jgi:hypothetical protein
MLSEGRTALVLAATGESEMETGEVPNRGVGRLEAYWTGVMERVKKQSEVHHSAIDADNERNRSIDFKA